MLLITGKQKCFQNMCIYKLCNGQSSVWNRYLLIIFWKQWQTNRPTRRRNIRLVFGFLYYGRSINERSGVRTLGSHPENTEAGFHMALELILSQYIEFLVVEGPGWRGLHSPNLCSWKNYFWELNGINFFLLKQRNVLLCSFLWECKIKTEILISSSLTLGF